MKKETIVKLPIAIIAVICIAWLGQIISNMIVVALAMTASVFGLIVALLLRYGINHSVCFKLLIQKKQIES